MRRHVLFPCDGSLLAGTIDEAPGKTGLLIVSGGNEVRSGAWGSQAQLAAAVAAAGFPVFRFDRRGVGDSEGGNGGFRSSAPDITAALATFREEAGVERIVAWGNCDAASALMLAGGAGADGLVLSNPWTFEDEAPGAPAPEAPSAVLRSHYLRRLADPAAIRRLLSGKVGLGGLVRSLVAAARPTTPARGPLASAMAAGIESYAGTVTFAVAERDRTAQAFIATWDKRDPRVRRCPDATHSFVEPHARAWLLTLLLEALKG